MQVAGNKRRTSAQAGYGGYLTKKGQLVRSWKKRWFQLSYGCLEYFEDEAAYQANKRNGEAYEVTNKNHTDLDEGAPFRPKGGILLVGAEIIHSDSEILQMGIICSDRTLTVKAEDAEKLQQWHTQLQLHIDLANEDALAMNDINDGVVKWVQRIAQVKRSKSRSDEPRRCVWIWIISNTTNTTSHATRFALRRSLPRERRGWPRVKHSKSTAVGCSVRRSMHELSS